MIAGFIAILLIFRAAWRSSYVWYITVPARDLAQAHSALLVPSTVERFLRDLREAVPKGSSVAVLLPRQPSIDEFPNSLTRRAMYVLAGRRVEQYRPGETLTADFLITLETPLSVAGYREIWSRDGCVLAEKTP